MHGAPYAALWTAFDASDALSAPTAASDELRCNVVGMCQMCNFIFIISNH